MITNLFFNNGSIQTNTIITTDTGLKEIKRREKIKAIDDEYITHASISDLNEKYGYTPEQIALDIERMLKS